VGDTIVVEAEMRYLMLPLLASGLLSGCTVDQNNALIILQNQIPDEECVVPATQGATFRPSGTLDVAVRPDGTSNSGYLFTPLVRSGLTAGQSVNQHIVFLGGADVELRSTGSESSDALVAALETAGLSKRTFLTSGSIPPGGSAGLAFVAIDGEQTAAMAAHLGAGAATTIYARVTVFGTVDEGDIVSSPFDYPITICDGCLVRNVGSCSTIPPDSELGQGGTCGLLQDGVLTCCNTGSGTRCPATPDE
jgi:hypothetical protein